MPLTSMVAGSTARASDVNNNFALCVLTDTSRTVTVTHTWTASQTFTGGWTAGAACTVSTGGLTVTAGGLTVTAGGLTVSASGAAITGNSTIAGTATITSTSASAFTAGANGATNPVLKVNANTASVATGIEITGAAAAGGVVLAAISSGTNENLAIDAKGSGTITLGGTSTGNIVLTRAASFSAGLTTTTIAATGQVALVSDQKLLLDGAAGNDYLMHASGAGAIQIFIAGTTAAQFTATSTAGATRLSIYDVDNGNVEQVTVGAADSGGSGYKLLRIPN